MSVNNILAWLRYVSKTQTIRQSGITLFGTVLNGVIGVAFYIFVARLLGPSDYGIFSFVTVVVAILASIANVGIDTGITRFVASSWETKRPRALRLLKTGFLMKLFSFSLLFLGGLMLADFVSKFVLHKAELYGPLRWALLGVGGSMLFSFGCAALQSLRRYWVWSLVNVFGNSLRLIVFFIFVLAGFSPVYVAILLFVFSPFFAFVLSLFFLPKFFDSKIKRTEFIELFHFNKWVAATTIIVAISTRLDSLYVTRLLTFEQVGYYSVAISLVGFISQIVLALGSVAAPKYATFSGKKEAWSYFSKLEMFVVSLCIFGVPVGLLMSKYMVPIVYGLEYSSSVAPLNVLIVAYAIFLVSMPIHTMVMYFYGNSRFFFWLALFRVALVSTIAWFLISEFGIIGAAYSVLAGTLIDFFIPLVYIFKKR